VNILIYKKPIKFSENIGNWKLIQYFNTKLIFYLNFYLKFICVVLFFLKSIQFIKQQKLINNSFYNFVVFISNLS
jgi:hypothetical protein